jgi:hypothetical protein
MTGEESTERVAEPEKASDVDLPPDTEAVNSLPTEPSKIGRQADGRFAPGNNANPTGRPLGSKHKATIAVEALLEGEAEKLTRKAVELALAGDTTALRLCLERLAPPAKSRRVKFNLPPLESPADILGEFGAVTEAMAAGELALDEAAAVVGILEARRKTLETVELERRLAALEQSSGANGKR